MLWKRISLANVVVNMVLCNAGDSYDAIFAASVGRTVTLTSEFDLVFHSKHKPKMPSRMQSILQDAYAAHYIILLLPSMLAAFSAFYLQCFDTVGWASGRVSGAC